MVKKTLLSTGLLGLLMAGALAIASETHGTQVSIDEALTIRGGCYGWQVDQCSGSMCGTCSIVVGSSLNQDESPSGQAIRCGGSETTSCSQCLQGATHCDS